MDRIPEILRKYWGVLLYSGGDFVTWKKLQSDLPPAPYEIAMAMLAGIESFCTTATCRHRTIVEYFGQPFAIDRCHACDVCLDEVEVVADSLVISQKILSCVARLNQAFGGDYTALVLTGSREQRIIENGHDRLSTYGLLSEQGKKHVRNWIDQLVGLGYLKKIGEYDVLSITDEGRRLLRGESVPRLLKHAERVRRETAVTPASWEGVDRDLFEALRTWRRSRAAERGLPPFMIFSDATLRNLARCRPSTRERLLEVRGIGEHKAAEYGDELVGVIGEYCRCHDLPQDVIDDSRLAAVPTGLGSSDSGAGLASAAKRQAAWPWAS